MISLSGLVRPRVFQLSVKLAEIFERKCQIGKFKLVHLDQRTVILYKKTKCKQNRFMSCHKFDWGNENTVNIWGHV